MNARLAGLVCAATAWVAPVGAADLDSILSQVMERFHLPGAVLLVSDPEETRVAARGLANLATRTPVTEDTRFHVASVGKILTAVAALQLVEEGKLALDEPVTPFLEPKAAQRLTHADTATVASLLSHTSGIPDCLRNASFSTPEHPSVTWTAAEALSLGKCRPATTPGAFSYSNSNYILLGRILETRDGGDLSASIARRILGPLEMSGSAVALDPKDPALAHGYRPADERGHRKDSWPLPWSSNLGDAPLTTTARDLERFFASLFRPNAKKILSPETLAAMTVERGAQDGEGYGYGLQLVDTDIGPRQGHSGRFGGFAAEAWRYPDQDRIVILLTNGDEHTADEPMDIVEAGLEWRSK